MDSDPVTKVVAVIDLSRYSDICKELEQHLGTKAVASVNDQIRNLIHLALAGAGLAVDQVPYKGTGDGAIVILETGKDASSFAEKLHRVAEEYNRGKDVPLAQRHFRVGVYTGPVIFQFGKGRKKTMDFAGSVIGNAVRLEGAAKTGEVLIDAETWANLPSDLRKLYGPTENVKGKREELFQAHRRRVVDRAPWDVVSTKPSPPTKNAGDSDNAEVIKLHKRRLGLLEQQAARYGALTPPEITAEIEDLEEEIPQLEAVLPSPMTKKPKADRTATHSEQLVRYLEAKEAIWRETPLSRALRAIMPSRGANAGEIFFSPRLTSGSRELTADELGTLPTRAVVLGMTGVGKSMLLNYIAWTSARRFLDPAVRGNVVPVLIDLPIHSRTISEGGSNALWSVLEKETGVPRSQFMSARYHYVFLFDSLDELRSHGIRLQTVVDAILLFLKQWGSDCSAILACRQEAHEVDEGFPGGWDSVTLQPLLEMPARSAFLECVFGSRHAAFIVETLEKSQASPRLIGIINTPLLLTQLGIVLTHQHALHEGGTLSPAEITVECMRILLESMGTGNDPNRPNRYSFQQKYRFLCLAAIHYLSGTCRNVREVINRKEARACFSHHLDEIGLFEELSVRSGVLRPDGSFQHEQFAEALAASFFFDYLRKEQRQEWAAVLPDPMDHYCGLFDFGLRQNVRNLVSCYIRALPEAKSIALTRRLCSLITSATDRRVVNNAGEVLIALDPDETTGTIVRMLHERDRGVTDKDTSFIWILGEVHGGNSRDSRAAALALLRKVLDGTLLANRNDLRHLTCPWHAAWAMEKIHAADMSVTDDLPPEQRGLYLLESTGVFDALEGLSFIQRNQDKLAYKAYTAVVVQKFKHNLGPSDKREFVRWLLPLPRDPASGTAVVGQEPSCNVCYNSCWLLGQLLDRDWFAAFAASDERHIDRWDAGGELRDRAVSVLRSVFEENESRDSPLLYMSSGVIEAIGKIGNRAACDFLVGVLENAVSYTYRSVFRAVEGLRRSARRALSPECQSSLAVSDGTGAKLFRMLDELGKECRNPRLLREVDSLRTLLPR